MRTFELPVSIRACGPVVCQGVVYNFKFHVFADLKGARTVKCRDSLSSRWRVEVQQGENWIKPLYWFDWNDHLMAEGGFV